MRKINAIVTVAIIILFLIHLVWGALQLLGMTGGGNAVFGKLAGLMMGLIVVHIAIGVKLTVDTMDACQKSGVSYWKENRLFWIRRISGFALMIFLFFHIAIFSGIDTAVGVRLQYFGVGRLATQILMVVSLMVHLLTNISPLRIAIGIKDSGNVRTDVLLVLSILLLLAGVAFVVYFIRWQMV